MSPQEEMEKHFDIINLQQEWTKYTNYIQETGEYMSDFLSSVQSVKIEGSTLILLLKSGFLRNWLNEEDNKLKLKNIIKYYVNTPIEFKLDFEVSNSTDMAKHKKVSRRYSDLTR